PWLECSWIDHIDRKHLPNVDVMALDNRTNKLLNRVQGGSLFDSSCKAYVRFTRSDNSAPEEEVTADATRMDRVEHTMRISKHSDGKIRFVFDGRPMMPDSSFLIDAGLGT